MVGDKPVKLFHLPIHPLKALPASEHFPLPAIPYPADSRIAEGGVSQLPSILTERFLLLSSQ